MSLYERYFADDIVTLDMISDHEDFRDVPTLQKPHYLLDDMEGIDNKLEVLYNVNDDIIANQHNRLWLNMVQARSASLIYSLNALIEHINTTRPDIRQQPEIERLCGYLHCHVQLIKHDMRYLEMRICMRTY